MIAIRSRSTPARRSVRRRRTRAIDSALPPGVLRAPAEPWLAIDSALPPGVLRAPAEPWLAIADDGSVAEVATPAAGVRTAARGTGGGVGLPSRCALRTVGASGSSSGRIVPPAACAGL